MPHFSAIFPVAIARTGRRVSLAMLLVGALALSAPGAQAAGLGGIEVYSTLYQPLDAEIEILNAKPGDIERLQVSLASEEDFRRTGIDQLSVFNSFRFDIINKNGRYFVHLTSGATVIREPFLHFLVNADWVYGKLVREYTVILDLPLFGEDSQQARRSDLVVPEEDHALDDSFGEGVPVLAEEPGEAEEEESHSDLLSRQELAAIPEEISEPEPEEELYEEIPAVEESFVPERIGEDQYGPVQSGENLWTIISGFKPDSITMNQAMLSVLRANADAFINDNINLLRTGVVLRIPGYEEMLELSRNDALEEARRQNALWEEYRASVSGASYRLEDAMEADSDDAVSFSNPLLTGLDTPSSTAPALQSQSPPSADSDTPAPPPGAEAGVPASQEATSLSILPGEQDTLGQEATGAGDAGQAGPGDSGRSETIARQFRENIETESVAGRSLQERLDSLSAQQKTAAAILDIQSDQGAQLQKQSEQILAQDGAQPGPPLPGPGQSLPEGSGETDAATATGTDAVAAADKKPLTLEEIIATQRQSDQPDPASTASPDLGLPGAVDQETPIDFLKIVLPRSMVNAGWGALADVADSPARILNYPVMLITVIFFLLMVAALVWRRLRRREGEEDSELATLHDLGDEFDEFGNPVGAAQQDLRGEDEEITALRGQEITALREAAHASEQLAASPEQPARAPESQSAPAEPAEPAPGADTGASEAPAAQAPSPTGQKPVAKDTSLGDSSDTTVTEASTYISYALYDQAEELLRDAIKRNPANANAYLSTLMDLYYTSGNKDELTRLAHTIKSDYGPGDLWEKIVVLGRAVAGEEAVFKDAQIEGKFTTSDFNIAPPSEADLALDSSEAESEKTDFAFTADDAGQVGADIQLSDDEDFLSQFEEDFDKTLADLGMGEANTSTGSPPGDDKKKTLSPPPGEGASSEETLQAAPEQIFGEAPPAGQADSDSAAAADSDKDPGGGQKSGHEETAGGEASGGSQASASSGLKAPAQTGDLKLVKSGKVPEPGTDLRDSDLDQAESGETRDVPAQTPASTPEPADDGAGADPASAGPDNDEPAGAPDESGAELSPPVAGLDLESLSASEIEEVMDSSRRPMQGNEESMQQLLQEVSADSARADPDDAGGSQSGDADLEKTSDIALDLKDIIGDDALDGEGNGKASADEHSSQSPETDQDTASLVHEETSSFMADILKAGDEDSDGEGFSGGTHTFTDDDDSSVGEDPFAKTITGSELMGELDSTGDDNEDLSLLVTDADGGKLIAENATSEGGDPQWDLYTAPSSTSSSTSTSIVSEEDELLSAFAKSGGEDEVDLGLAEQYIGLGDNESARVALLRIIEKGSAQAREKARAMLAGIEKEE